MSTATRTLAAYLIDLWKASELYAGEEIKMTMGGTLYTAWDIDQQRVCMKFIVDRPRTKEEFDDLSIDLALLMHDEANKMRDAEIANGYAEDEAADLSIHYGPYYVDVYLTTRDHAEIRKADLLGIYAPELFLHFVPFHSIESGAQ